MGVSESSAVATKTPPAGPPSPAGYHGGQSSVGPYEPTLKHSVGNMVGGPERVSVSDAHQHSEAEPSDQSKKISALTVSWCARNQVFWKSTSAHTPMKGLFPVILVDFLQDKVKSVQALQIKDSYS
eukprot:TRINITY_DN26905_c0_g1_i1.p1 TRINITY_DN26905_c0_g1~~TRINITY_DN26905_c0_g1_i1.p1  ORF type:complete len:134 (-),score=34.30 TRINITY_DN26905_c0_g1_i1:78-455(-)